MKLTTWLWALMVGILCWSAPAHAGLSARGSFDGGPTPSTVNAQTTTNFTMTVRNQGAGTFFEVRVGNAPSGITVRSTSGRQFISGSQSKTFNLTISPDNSVADHRITLQLWGDSEAGDVELLQSQIVTIKAINPPGSFLITFPEFNATVGPGPFTMNWSTSSGADNYDIQIFKMVNGARQQPAVFVQEKLLANAIQFDTAKLFERGALYQIDMYANNVVGRRLVSNPSHQFTVVGLPQPGSFRISAPTAGALTTTTPTVEWGASTSAINYSVFLYTEVSGSPSESPAATFPNLTTTSFTLPALQAGRTYYVRVLATAEGGTRFNDDGAIRFQVQPAPAVLSSTWYFAEGAAFDWLDTYYLLANPLDDAITVDIEFLVESGSNRTVTFTVPPRRRETVRVNDWVSDVGVSGVLRERTGKSFGAERAMYSIGEGRRWVGATSVTGIASPRPEWFLAEGATSSAGNGDFQTFVLVANPQTIPLTLDVTFFPQGGIPLDFTFEIAAGRRLTIEPAVLTPDLRGRSFSTRVRSRDGSGILVERAMWWTNADWTGSPFAEGNASPGIPDLARTWYLAEGNTLEFDEFLLLVNPNPLAVTVDVRYLISTAEPADRRLTLEPNSRTTINVRYDDLGLRAGNTHGTMIVASHPIAVERSMYFNLEGGSGWIGGTNAVASPHAAKAWIFPEGAEFPFAESKLTTSFAVANPTGQTATLTFAFLFADGSEFTLTRELQGFRRMTIETNDFAQLFDTAFSTTISSTQPVVAERTMVFGTGVPRTVARIGATGSLGVPVGDLTIQTALPSTAVSTRSVAGSRALPTPTPTPVPSPTPAIR